jgi:hypothetical protein
MEWIFEGNRGKRKKIDPRSMMTWLGCEIWVSEIPGHEKKRYNIREKIKTSRGKTLSCGNQSFLFLDRFLWSRLDSVRKENVAFIDVIKWKIKPDEKCVHAILAIFREVRLSGVCDLTQDREPASFTS